STDKDLPNAPPGTDQSTPNMQPETTAAAAGQAAVLPPGSPSQQSTTTTPPTQPQPIAKSGEPERYAVTSTPGDASTAPPVVTGGNGTTPPPEAPAKVAEITNPSVVSKSAATEPASKITQPGDATANVPSTPAPPQSTKTIPPEAGEAAATPPADAVAAGVAPVVPATPDLNAKVGANAQAPSAPVELGTYMGGKTVLLRFDGKTGGWFRVEPRA